MLKKWRDLLLLPAFFILALVLPEEQDENLRAERELIERTEEDGGSGRR